MGAYEQTDTRVEDLIKEAIRWKYDIHRDADIDRRFRQLRYTDKQELLWEYEDYLLEEEHSG